MTCITNRIRMFLFGIVVAFMGIVNPDETLRVIAKLMKNINASTD
jgi:disulfide bond formation protein DsbB